MKNGLLIYETTKDINMFNIGDYIQSLAAKQFFKRPINIYVDREHLNEYKAEEKTLLIMNGWFMHTPQNWPPSDDILPLFVAFHINKLAESHLTSAQSIKYLKKYEPIGCRDINTVAMLKKQGIDAYFSGCLTLTLGLRYKKNDSLGEEIYFTDVAEPPVKKNIFKLSLYLFNLLKNYNLIKQICARKYKKINLRNLILTTIFYDVYKRVFTPEVLRSAKYIQQEIRDNFNTEDEKFKYAETLLNDYAKAKFVVTSRIHCALPCLALNSPVLYVENVNQSEVSACRLNGLKEFFHIIKLDNYHLKSPFSQKIDTNFVFKNKEDYKKYKESLIKTCKQFLEKYESAMDN